MPKEVYFTGGFIVKITKTITLFMIICLTFTACSLNSANLNEDNESATDISGDENAAEDTTEVSYYETLGERNFNGDTFTILDANDHTDFFINFSVEDALTGEPINDALYERDKSIEERYGVDIAYIQITNGRNGCETLQKSVLAGDNEYDMIVSELLGGALDAISTQNVLYNLMDAPYLSLQSPWWSSLVYNNMQFNNKLYYIGGDIFLPSYSQGPAAMMFNKKLLDDYGINENLYSMVFEGKWTIDVLERLTKDTNQDLNQDGKMIAADDFYGLIYQNNTVTAGFWAAGLGVKFSTVADNTINIDLTSPDSLSKIDKLTNMLEKPVYDNQMDIIDITFSGGKALFLAHCLNTPQMFLRDMEDDYGILPMPKYDEIQESYANFINAWVSGFVAIPQNADIEKSAFLTGAMGYAGYEILRRPVYDITLKAKGARDEESEQMLDIIIETAYMDINSVYNFGGSCDIIRDVIMDKKPFVSEYEKKEPAIREAAEKFIETMSSNN
jgi:hypothetical protein